MLYAKDPNYPASGKLALIEAFNLYAKLYKTEIMQMIFTSFTAAGL